MVLEPRTCVLSRVFLAVVLIIALAVSTDRSLAQNAPSFARQPVIVEYDVDPSWPRTPEDVSSEGWVSGLAIDSASQVWLFKKGPDPVQVYTTDGRFVKSWGQGKFVDPHQLRIDHEGNVWLADFGRHVVEKYSTEGKLLLRLGTPGESGQDAAHFNRPTDMAIAPSGDVFVTDGYGNRRVVKFDRDGNFIQTWGEYGSGPGEFVLPHAIALDSSGRLYVADRNSGRIQVFSQQGELLDSWDNLIMPWGLSVNRDDRIWVCGSSPHWWRRDGKYHEYKDQIFLRFDTDGRARQLWGIPLAKSKEDQRPGEAIGIHCIAEDSDGNLYVGDIYGERAQKFMPVTQRPNSNP